MWELILNVECTRKLFISFFEDFCISLHSWTKFSALRPDNCQEYLTILRKVSMRYNSVLFLRACLIHVVGTPFKFSFNPLTGVHFV